ncbi:type I restriction endonuclease subunit R [Candidatus Micrarchaeota archaeon]|nr:type I restriction endonuclease subunit R [Candidatus Micrarchaeota archaeon]
MIQNTEAQLENDFLKMLETQGYSIKFGPDIAPDGDKPERESFKDVVLKERLRSAIAKLNPQFSASEREDALKQILRLDSPNVISNNFHFHKLLCEGAYVEIKKGKETRHQEIKLIDWNTPENNEFLAINQFTIIENENRRPDVILFINGLPLVLMEFKRSNDEKATSRTAFDQLQTYMKDIPTIFNYNEILVATDGYEAKIGTISSDYERFSPWKMIDGKRNSKITQLELLTKGMLRKDVLLDLIRNFIVFEDKEIKKVAAYHQYNAVNKAITSTIRASSEKGDKRIGVIWHTQGAGKSLSMVFYSGKVIADMNNNPTLVVLTDRNDLDGQLFDTFARCQHILRNTPKQAGSRPELKDLLKVASGGIVFTTIQKFFPENKFDKFPLLSDRRNIIVIADEAHRSQYDFIDGFAKHMRDALPNASFIGFTGTPIEKKDKNTRAVFGDYVDIYDMKQAVEDGVTVRIYYESRLVPLDLDETKKALLEKQVKMITELEENTPEYLKWASLEAVAGSETRLKKLAKDIIEHFEARRLGNDGKGIIVCMSRRICVELYNEIIKLKPDWYDKNDDKGFLKVIMTGSASDTKWQEHIRTKKKRDTLRKAIAKPESPIKMVIVRDMLLTGFDAPCMHTMYIDKPMESHTLMQAIARVNRTYKEKTGGRIVDYIGIGYDLKKATEQYSAEGGEGSPCDYLDQAANVFLERYEITKTILHGFDYSGYFKAKNLMDRNNVLLAAEDYILREPEGKKRYLDAAAALLSAFNLAKPHETTTRLANEIKFFNDLKVRLAKFDTSGHSRDQTNRIMERAFRQVVSGALITEEVIDLFDAAGLKKPEISILSDEFLDEVRGIKYKNLAIETLRKLLNDEIKAKMKKDVLKSKEFLEKLRETILEYQNRILDSTEMIQRLIELAKEVRDYSKEGDQLGLTENELAFYHALADNKSALEVLGNDQLGLLSKEIVRTLKEKRTIDWAIRESAKAKLRLEVRKVLRKYGYPPDEEKMAILRVIEQAENSLENNSELSA